MKGRSPASSPTAAAGPSTGRSVRGREGSDALGGERGELEEDRGRVHRGDVVRAVFGRHEADDVAADEIVPAKSLEDARCLRHREAVLAGFEVRYAGCDARVEAVEIEADVEGVVADSLEHLGDDTVAAEFVAAFLVEPEVAELVGHVCLCPGGHVTARAQLNARAWVDEVFMHRLARPVRGRVDNTEPRVDPVVGVEVSVKVNEREWTLCRRERAQDRER